MIPVRSLLCAVLTAAVLLAAAAIPARAPAAGMITHAWMADEAVNHVASPELERLLVLHHHELLSGASFPDTGYAAGGYGEISHWERFVNGYIEYLRGRPGCGDLSDPLGPCAPLVAHMFGAAAHGMGDEMWDWLFEPLVADHGESPEFPVQFPPPAEAANVISSIEYAMDTIALADHFRWGESGYFLPPPNELTPIYDAIGHGQTTEADLLSGFTVGSAALTAERAGGVADAPRVREQLPWASAHMDDESGGVQDAAGGIAGYYDALWAKLNGEAPAPKLVAVHPEDGEEDVPFGFQPERSSPGLSSGGGELRIVAVLSSAVDPATVTAADFRLLGPDGASVAAAVAGADPTAHHHDHDAHAGAASPGEVAPLEGFPRPGPYGGSDGTHSLMLYPAGDLAPCSTYTVLLGAGITDFAELPINTGKHLEQPATWTFSTRSADGLPCPRIVPPLELPRCGGRTATVFEAGDAAGSPGRLRGSDGPDVIVASSGDDVIRGEGGGDLICAGGGDDAIVAGAGRDELRGGAGADTISGGTGTDLLHGHRDSDVLRGGPGRDAVHAGAGDDELRGNRGADLLTGRSGADRLHGGRGRDRCKGGSPGSADHGRGCEQASGIP